ncbi:MAG: methyl-accepting chemotaxis protein, partial [Brevinematia bacterium]
RDEAMRGSEEVRRNVEEVRDVNVFLGNVLEVVDVVKSIADRIEVLSMNAGIEAAHAGERGRGFAVVAEEMGSLAEDSRRKAEEIGKMVRDVIERVKIGIEGVEENGEEFVKVADGIKEVSAFVSEIDASMVEVGKTNEVLMKAISDLMSYSEGIKVAVEESKSGMGEIVRAVYEVNESVSGLSDKFGKVYSVLKGGVEVLSGASEKLAIVLESLRKLSDELGRFKVSEVKFSKNITLVE